MISGCNIVTKRVQLIKTEWSLAGELCDSDTQWVNSCEPILNPVLITESHNDLLRWFKQSIPHCVTVNNYTQFRLNGNVNTYTNYVLAMVKPAQHAFHCTRVCSCMLLKSCSQTAQFVNACDGLADKAHEAQKLWPVLAVEDAPTYHNAAWNSNIWPEFTILVRECENVGLHVYYYFPKNVTNWTYNNEEKDALMLSNDDGYYEIERAPDQTTHIPTLTPCPALTFCAL